MTGLRIGRRHRPWSAGLLLLSGGLLAPAIIGTRVAGARPAPALLAQGDPITVDVVVRRVARLYGADLVLRYDPAQLQPIDALPSTPGIQAQVGAAWGPSPLVVVNETDTNKGELHLAVALLAPARPLAGDLVLASMGFLPRRSPLEDAYGLVDALLVSQGGSPIPARWAGVVIEPLVDWGKVIPRLWLPRVMPGERDGARTASPQRPASQASSRPRSGSAGSRALKAASRAAAEARSPVAASTRTAAWSKAADGAGKPRRSWTASR